MINLSDDLQVLAATIYGEARGEDFFGQQAVASVVRNRVLVARQTGRKQFGDGSYHSCCLVPWQFSCWNHNDPNRSKLLTLDFTKPDPVLEQCVATAQATMDGNETDLTGGALYYKTSVLPWPKDWGQQVPPLKVIGSQSFYKLIESNQKELIHMTSTTPTASDLLTQTVALLKVDVSTEAQELLTNFFKDVSAAPTVAGVIAAGAKLAASAPLALPALESTVIAQFATIGAQLTAKLSPIVPVSTPAVN